MIKIANKILYCFGKKYIKNYKINLSELGKDYYCSDIIFSSTNYEFDIFIDVHYYSNFGFIVSSKYTNKIIATINFGLDTLFNESRVINELFKIFI